MAGVKLRGDGEKSKRKTRSRIALWVNMATTMRVRLVRGDAWRSALTARQIEISARPPRGKQSRRAREKVVPAQRGRRITCNYCKTFTPRRIRPQLLFGETILPPRLSDCRANIRRFFRSFCSCFLPTCPVHLLVKETLIARPIWVRDVLDGATPYPSTPTQHPPPEMSD